VSAPGFSGKRNQTVRQGGHTEPSVMTCRQHCTISTGTRVEKVSVAQRSADADRIHLSRPMKIEQLTAELVAVKWHRRKCHSGVSLASLESACPVQHTETTGHWNSFRYGTSSPSRSVSCFVCCWSSPPANIPETDREHPESAGGGSGGTAGAARKSRGVDNSE